MRLGATAIRTMAIRRLKWAWDFGPVFKMFLIVISRLFWGQIWPVGVPLTSVRGLTRRFGLPASSATR